MIAIRTESVTSCILCKVNGKKQSEVFSDRRGYVEGVFGINRCPGCGLLWLDPRPALEEASKCYGYFEIIPKEIDESTRSVVFRPFAKLRDDLRAAILCGYFGYQDLHLLHRFCYLGGFLGKLQFLRRKAAYDGDLFLPLASQRSKGIYIDVGCGMGGLLKFLKRLGWEVLGVEPNARAADIAESQGIRVIRNNIENARILPESAAYISLRHVIEHLSDPLKAMRICWEALKPGGKLIITTPNINSCGYTVFKQDWYALDIPRHFYFFSTSTIKLLLGNFNFRKVITKTSSIRAKIYFDQSAGIRKNDRYYLENEKICLSKGRNLFAFKEGLCRIFGSDCAEEISVVAIK